MGRILLIDDDNSLREVVQFILTDAGHEVLPAADGAAGLELLAREPDLVINLTKAKLICLDCDIEYEAKDFYQGCPDCGSISRRILSGREFTVDSVELEEGND